MNKDDNLDPEPPELRQQGIPPLKKIIKYVFIAIAIALVIVLAFSLILKQQARINNRYCLFLKVFFPALFYQVSY